MIDNQSVAHNPTRQPKKIPIHERSVRVGDVVVINAHRANHRLLKQRFAEGGYCLHETKHFLLFTRAEEPKTVLAHWFASEELHTNLSHHLAEELKPFGIITSNQILGEFMAVHFFMDFLFK